MGVGSPMEDLIYMAVSSYRLRNDRGSPTPLITPSLARVVEACKGGLISLRAYYSLSSGVHAIIWGSSDSPEDLLLLRECLYGGLHDYFDEVYWWISIYKKSPYVEKAETSVREMLMREPLKFFIAYPMKKHPEWYLLPMDERREIMIEHIKIAARTHKGDTIRSYTTYAFGIADYEFLVIYEAADLYEWSKAVEVLREARARKWVVLEEPVLVGISASSPIKSQG